MTRCRSWRSQSSPAAIFGCFVKPGRRQDLTRVRPGDLEAFQSHRYRHRKALLIRAFRIGVGPSPHIIPTRRNEVGPRSPVSSGYLVHSPAHRHAPAGRATGHEPAGSVQNGASSAAGLPILLSVRRGLGSISEHFRLYPHRADGVRCRVGQSALGRSELKM